MKKTNDKITIRTEISDKIPITEIEAPMESEKLDENVKKLPFYYIVKCDYNQYKKGDIISGEQEINNFIDLNKVIKVINK